MLMVCVCVWVEANMGHDGIMMYASDCVGVCVCVFLVCPDMKMLCGH